MVDKYEENQSYLGKRKFIVIALSDICGCSSLMLSSTEQVSGSFLKFSCIVESETVISIFLVLCYSRAWSATWGVLPCIILKYACVGHLENNFLG